MEIRRRNGGFTLIEMAVAMVVIVLLLSGLLVPLATQIDQRRLTETQKAMSEVRDALLGFAIANGRLPCPATAASGGAEAFAAGSSALQGTCNTAFNGFVPAVTLGITPVNDQGLAVDGWGNPLRYAVTDAADTITPAWKAFTRTNGVRENGISALAPNLVVCATSSGILPTGCGTAQPLTNASPNGAVAVIISLGPNGATAATGADELANQNGDAVFVSHVRSTSNAAGGEFDDVVTWLSPALLYNRMVAAGRLP